MKPISSGNSAHPATGIWDKADKPRHFIARRDEPTPSGGFVRWYDFQVPPDEVRRFYFGVRPVEYAEFQNVSLRPGKKTPVTVVPVRAADLVTRPAPRRGGG